MILTTITSPKERAVSASSRLLVALIDSVRYKMPSGKFCMGILRVLSQPALPGDINLETRKAVTSWRASAGFGRLSDTEMTKISDELEPLVKAIRISISQEIVKRENRRQDFNKREEKKPKHDTRRRQAFKPAPSAWSKDPYAD